TEVANSTFGVAKKVTVLTCRPAVHPNDTVGHPEACESGWRRRPPGVNALVLYLQRKSAVGGAHDDVGFRAFEAAEVLRERVARHVDRWWRSWLRNPEEEFEGTSEDDRVDAVADSAVREHNHGHQRCREHREQ